MKVNIKDARRLFPATKKVKYFFNGGVCLIPTPVEEALKEFIVQNESGFNAENWKTWNDNVSQAYGLFAEMVGANPTEVVGIPNTSVGTGMIAHMVDPRKGSNVVFDDLEYNTIYPFTMLAKRGVGPRVVRNDGNGSMDVGQFEKSIDDKTAAVVVSAVSCWNGYRYDLRELSEIAHRHGAYLVVDAAQQAGAVKLDVRRDGVDFLATCGHKWLLGPPGTGFMYVREELIEKFDPPLPGWMGIEDPGTFEVWKPKFPKTAHRFETGMPEAMLLNGLRASMQMIKELGRSRVEDEILKRSGYLIEKLQDTKVKLFTPVEKEHRAGVVTFLLRKHQQLYDELLKNSFIVFHHPKEVARNLRWPYSGLRVDPTFFNTYEELDELVAHVKRWAA
jgi:cysteine desulfurase/selenocysteine lyase